MTTIKCDVCETIIPHDQRITATFYFDGFKLGAIDICRECAEELAPHMDFTKPRDRPVKDLSRGPGRVLDISK